MSPVNVVCEPSFRVVTTPVTVRPDGSVSSRCTWASVTNVTTRYNRNGSIPGSFVNDLYNGTIGDVTRLVNPANGASPAYNPIYKMPLSYQTGRTMTLGVRFLF